LKSHDVASRRVLHATLFLEEGQTMRSVSARTGSSRSTVCSDLIRVNEQDHDLYLAVREKVGYNISMRHIRGGESSRQAKEQARLQKLQGELNNETEN
jgi:putative DeoR family transcriptional regulator (stage III sporulation protein D)